MVKVELKNIYKTYQGGKVIAADVPYLSIENGEFFGLLGSSGSGKTTTLRIIAGLTMPDRGNVYFDGEDVTRVPPEKRGLGMVFQSWALFPHLTVFENIAFGLRLRKVPEDEIKRKVRWAAELLRIEELLDRYPYQLSGGQQQRVSVARAIVIEPKALLFDEPLSNLDAKLREQVRFELRRLQRELGITSVYVTHDQAEAFAICDRLAIMNKGRIEQIGKPEEIYNSPATLFVAEFLGITSIIPVKILRVENADQQLVAVEIKDCGLELVARTNLEKTKVGDNAWLIVRPEHVNLAASNSKLNVIEAKVSAGSYFGDHAMYLLDICGYQLRLRTAPEFRIGIGEQVRVKLDENKLFVIPKT